MADHKVSLSKNIDITTLPEVGKRFETLFQNMVRGAILGRMIYDESGAGIDFAILMVNEAFTRLTGYDKEVIGRRISEIFPGKSPGGEELIRMFGTVALSGERRRLEIYIEQFENWFDLAVYSPEKEYVYLTFDIITEKKRTFEELEASEERYRAIFNTALVGIGIFNTDGKLRLHNQKALKNMGLADKEVVGKTFLDIFGENGRVDHERVISVAKGNGELSFTESHNGPNGPCWFNTTYTPITSSAGQINGVQMVSFDITEYKNAEEGIRMINEKLARAQKITHIGNWEHDLLTGQISWSDEMYRIFGLPLHSAVTVETLMQTFHQEELELFNKAFLDLIERNIPYRYDFRICRPDGEEIYIHSEGSLQNDNEGKPVLFYGTTQDITDRIKMQVELEESEKKYRDIVELSPDAVFINHENKILFANKAALTLCGYDSMEELLKVPPFSFVHPDQREEAIGRSLKVIKKGKLDDFKERNFIRRTGEMIPVEVAVQPVYYRRKKALQVTIRDIRLRKKAEEKIREFTQQIRAMAHHHEQVRESERMKLAREIHDILGVSLSGIKLNLEVLRKSMKNYCKENAGINEQIDYMMKITGDAIESVRDVIYGLRPGILDELGFVEAVRWYSAETQSRNNLKFDVFVDPEEISVKSQKSIILFRIFQEIVANIRQHAKATKVRVQIRKEKKTLFISVKDNGIGIRKKDIGKASSFGILGIRERVILLKGKVEFRGTASKGTLVEIEVPLT